jgi:hypothetical protein
VLIPLYSHYCTRTLHSQGAHIVYYPKATKFRVYVVVDECAFGVCVNKGVTPDDANAYQWSISWMGTVSKVINQCTYSIAVIIISVHTV